MDKFRTRSRSWVNYLNCFELFYIPVYITEGWGNLGHLKITELSDQVYFIIQTEGPSALRGCFCGRIHTYIKDDGRGWSEALDANIREHFKHVAFPACNVNKSERAVIRKSVDEGEGCCMITEQVCPEHHNPGHRERD